MQLLHANENCEPHIEVTRPANDWHRNHMINYNIIIIIIKCKNSNNTSIDFEFTFMQSFWILHIQYVYG